MDHPASTLVPAPAESKQRLIDATLTAIAEHGISNLTLAKIAGIAGLTAGTVNFHFASKEALLLATLRAVAEEFEQAVSACLAAAGDDPAETLKAIIEVNLDPRLSQARKVAVWYAFLSESRARKEYQRLCGDRDAAYFDTVVHLCEQIARDSSSVPRPDAKAIAYGLVGILDELWQEILFEGDGYDRNAAKTRCLSYLASVFPWRFPMPGSEARPRHAPRPGPALAPVDEDGLSHTLPGWVYSHPEFAALEAALLFLPAWQLVCHASDLPQAGSFVTFTMLGERAFVVRGEDGRLRAFHNVCRHRAHALVAGTEGRCAGSRLQCPYHGWTYELDGRLRTIAAPETFKGRLDPERMGLVPLEMEEYLGFVFLRFRSGGHSVAEQFAPLHEEFSRYRTADMVRCPDRYGGGGFWEKEVDIDWKNGLENYLEDYHFPTGHRGLSALMKNRYERSLASTGIVRLSHELRDQPTRNWSARMYGKLFAPPSHLPAEMQRRWTYYAMFPATFFDLYPEKMDFFQMIPCGAGRIRLRGRSYALPDPGRRTRALRYLNDRLNMRVQAEDNDLTLSVQGGLASCAYGVGVLSDRESMVKGFQDWLRERLPVARLLQPPPSGELRTWNDRLATDRRDVGTARAAGATASQAGTVQPAGPMGTP